MPKQTKVLLVEDDPLVIHMYQHKLLIEGFALVMAFNGEEGLAAIKKDRPDIVLLDIMMPKMDGLETLRRIKADPQYKDLPVVMLTNLGDRQDDVENCKKMGAEDYWVKANIRLDDITHNINKIIAQHRR